MLVAAARGVSRAACTAVVQAARAAPAAAAALAAVEGMGGRLTGLVQYSSVSAVEADSAWLTQVWSLLVPW